MWLSAAVQALGFQSTLPYGSDEKLIKSVNAELEISIHAPLRERRGVEVLRQGKQHHFNPRSLTGATVPLN